MPLLSLLLLFLAANSALSSRIVGFITLGGSQYINIKHTLEELASRGHEVGYKLQIEVGRFGQVGSSDSFKLHLLFDGIKEKRIIC